MSLEVDGVWRAGVWGATIWADGVWYEGAPPEPPADEAPDYGWVGRVLDRYRTDDEIRRERIARGIIPDDTPAEVATAVREAANLPAALQASRLRRLERDTAELAELLTLTERLSEAQREAQTAAYDALMAELAQEQTEYTQLQRNQNALAVLMMLGAM